MQCQTGAERVPYIFNISADRPTQDEYIDSELSQSVRIGCVLFGITYSAGTIGTCHNLPIYRGRKPASQTNGMSRSCKTSTASPGLHPAGCRKHCAFGSLRTSNKQLFGGCTTSAVAQDTPQDNAVVFCCAERPTCVVAVALVVVELIYIEARFAIAYNVVAAPSIRGRVCVLLKTDSRSTLPKMKTLT